MVVEYCFDTGSEWAGSVRFERAGLDLNSLVQWHRSALHNATLPPCIYESMDTCIKTGGICIRASRKYCTLRPKSFRADREGKNTRFGQTFNIYLLQSSFHLARHRA